MPVFSLNEPPSAEALIDAVTPIISSLEPNTCAIGDSDFTLVITGERFSDQSEIIFANYPEPTTLSEDKTQVSTGVKPSLWGAPAVVQCSVKNGAQESNALDFTFTEAAGG